MLSDDDFIRLLNDLERAANNIRNDFNAYKFDEYIENEYVMKNVKAKAKVLHDMFRKMAENKIAMMALAHDAINHRRQLIDQIAKNPHVKENWETIMMALMMLSD